MLETLLIAVFAGSIGLLYAHSKEIKKLEARIIKLSSELYELRQDLSELEGLKRGDRQALDAVQHVMFREQLHKLVKEAGAESLLS